ncbi:MAG TPA: FAD-binding oxidoreductase, partial [Phaeodactylibacter sp.]|nr:FAD-binding oxidoreductase [Phaeodactylibacter sp.]
MKPHSKLPPGLEAEFTPLARALYATDASMYREQPVGVVFPKSAEEVQRLVAFASQQHIPLIPRAAGTSLAGQCVGGGLVVDVSRYMNQILDLDVERRRVRVQPGVVRDELNQFLAPHGLWFGPNTSTSNRCTLGGMAGNNSCGSTSIAYGTTRDHLLEMEVILSSGERAVFGELDEQAFAKCLQGEDRVGQIYRAMHQLLSREEVRREVVARFPKAGIHRRNTGYALDVLLNAAPYRPDGPPLNLAKLLCGSEGTLAFTVSLTLELSPLPPPETALFLPHFKSLDEALRAVQILMQHRLYACELMDKALLDCTRNSRAQQANRFFLQGAPEGVLIVECRGQKREEVEKQTAALEQSLREEGLGYAFPRVWGKEVAKVWSLRKAALGVLANLPGRARSIPCVEDTAVDVADLPEYVRDFSRIMAAHQQQAVYYGHAGAGELHLRPTLDLREPKDFADLRSISRASAELVARYRGSLSGEHGDGRLRAEFIPLVMGEKITSYFEQVKAIWDPRGLFNPGKIVHPPRMDEALRISPSSPWPEPETLLDFSASGGIFGAAQKCTGSGDCRKSHRFAGNMCPSFQATRDEKHSTRGRANALREFLQRPVPHPFDSEALKEALSLCLSCKACTSECPSGVNMTALKAEFLYQYYQHHRRPLRDWFFKNMDGLFALAGKLGPLTPLLRLRPAQWLLRKALGLSGRRRLPMPPGHTFFRQFAKMPAAAPGWRGRLYLFVDPFTNYLEPEIPLAAVRLLRALGYEVHCPKRPAAGRVLLSRGYLKEAR